MTLRITLTLTALISVAMALVACGNETPSAAATAMPIIAATPIATPTKAPALPESPSPSPAQPIPTPTPTLIPPPTATPTKTPTAAPTATPILIPMPTKLPTPTQTPTTPPTSAPTATPTPPSTAEPAPAPTPEPAPTATPTPQPKPTATLIPTRTPTPTLPTHPTPSPITNLENGAWLERNQPAQATQLTQLPWIADGVDESEREAAEDLIRAARSNPDVFNILMGMPWIQDSAITTDEAKATQQILLSAYSSTAMTKQMSQKPWVLDGITATEANAMFDLARAIREEPALAERMLELPWVQDGITAAEAETIRHLRRVEEKAPLLAVRMLDFHWLQDGITETERDAVSYLRYLNYDNQKAAAAIIAMPWIQDNITETEGDAIKYLRQIGNRDSDAAAAIIAMPFLKTLELDDVLALHALSDPRHNDTLDIILEHPSLRNGITDDLTTLVAAVGVIREAEEVRRMLNPGYAKIEVLTEGTALTPDLKISIVRTENPSWDGAAQGLKFAVDLVESGMKLPLPVPHLIVVINDLATEEGFGAQYHGFAISIHTRNEKPVRYASGKDMLHSTYVHEITHYYVNSDFAESWLCNGLATTFEYIYRLEGRPPSEVPQRIWQVNRRGDCDAHNLKMHSERGKSAKTSCKYYLGLGLFSDLAESMGYEEYYEGVRRLYRLSLAVRESGGIMGIAEVRQAFPDQADIVEKHWAGNLNAPENRTD